jgi:hypothetical protein
MGVMCRSTLLALIFMRSAGTLPATAFLCTYLSADYMANPDDYPNAACEKLSVI